MPGHFTEDTAWTRGRPLTEIPSNLAHILDTTYADNRDYVIPVGDDEEEVQELIRFGKLHARHKGLSFRYYFSENDTGVPQIRFRLTDKRTYVKKNTEYWKGGTT